jgi:CDP-paratose 2-epimerase
MNYKTILVTGGAGFVGSNLAVAFKEKYPKTRVIALDNLKRRGSEINISRLKENSISFIHADIRTPEDLALDTKIDLIIECSAEPAVTSGIMGNPLYIINTNLTGTVNCLELARSNQADIIFLSTNRVYSYVALNEIRVKTGRSRFIWQPGVGQKITGWSGDGINENFTTDGPKSFYGATKFASEALIREYIENYGIKGVINRFSPIAGPWQFGRVDQGIFGFWMIAHYFRLPLCYIGFGGRGLQVRDILHVDDLFELIERQIHSLDKINGEVFNAGGGKQASLSLLELTGICSSLTGNNLKVDSVLEERPADIKMYITDFNKAVNLLGWRPKKSPDETLFDIYKWICDNQLRLRQSLF